MKVRFFLCLWLLLLQGLCWAQSASDYFIPFADSSQLSTMKEGLQLIHDGQTSKAIKKIKRLSDKNQDFFQAHMTLGYFFQEKNNPDKAFYYFSRAIKSKPTSAIAYFNRGNCSLIQKKYNLAVADFSQAIRCDSMLFAAYNNLAVTRILNQGGGNLRDSELQLAKENLKRVEKIKPITEPSMIMNLGLIYLHLFDFRAAFPYFEKALQADTTSGKPHYYMALCQYYLRNFPEARGLFLQSHSRNFNKEQCSEFIRFIDYIFEQITEKN